MIDHQMNEMLAEVAELRARCEQRGYMFEERNPGPPTYQFAKITGPGFAAIVYPHKTKGTGNRNLRIRDEGSQDKAAFRAFSLEQSEITGHNNTFHTKHQSTTEYLHRKGAKAQR